LEFGFAQTTSHSQVTSDWAWEFWYHLSKVAADASGAGALNLNDLEVFGTFAWLLTEAQRQDVAKWSKELLAGGGGGCLVVAPRKRDASTQGKPSAAEKKAKSASASSSTSKVASYFD